MTNSNLPKYNEVECALQIFECGRTFCFPTDEMKNFANKCHELYNSPIQMDDYQLTKIQGGFVIRDNKGEGKYLYGISDEGNSFSSIITNNEHYLYNENDFDITPVFRKFFNNIM